MKLRKVDLPDSSTLLMILRQTNSRQTRGLTNRIYSVNVVSIKWLFIFLNELLFHNEEHVVNWVCLSMNFIITDLKKCYDLRKTNYDYSRIFNSVSFNWHDKKACRIIFWNIYLVNQKGIPIRLISQFTEFCRNFS